MLSILRRVLLRGRVGSVRTHGRHAGWQHRDGHDRRGEIEANSVHRGNLTNMLQTPSASTLLTRVDRLMT